MSILQKTMPYALSALLPLAALAQTTATVNTILNTVSDILDLVIPILLIIATVVFLWGVIQYLTAGADEERRASARSLMIYGLVALFVMVAVWGIVKVLVTTFNVGGSGIPGNVGSI